MKYESKIGAPLYNNIISVSGRKSLKQTKDPYSKNSDINNIILSSRYGSISNQNYAKMNRSSRSKINKRDSIVLPNLKN